MTMIEREVVIEIRLNGDSLSISPETTIGRLLDANNIERRMVAVEHNGEIVPRYEFDTTTIEAGDQLELLQMVGGGR